MTFNTYRTESKAMSRDAKFQLLQSELEQIRTELKKTQEVFEIFSCFMVYVLTYCLGIFCLSGVCN